MVYNLVKYFTDKTTLNVYADGFDQDSPDDCLTIMESGGNEQNWFNRKDVLIQGVSRSKSKATARTISVTAYEKIKKKYGLILPAVTVDSVTYSAVKTWAIRPVTVPQYIGEDENGRAMFTFNVEITLTN